MEAAGGPGAMFGACVIVGALRAVGLTGEARMIAVEALTRL